MFSNPPIKKQSLGQICIRICFVCQHLEWPFHKNVVHMLEIKDKLEPFIFLRNEEVKPDLLFTKGTISMVIFASKLYTVAQRPREFVVVVL